MMCQVPEDVTFATYRAVEGVVTPNGALHGTILEYNCNIGYRYSYILCTSTIHMVLHFTLFAFFLGFFILHFL